MARFRAGDEVRVRSDHPPGHVRTPFFVRGKAGVVARFIGDFPNPEELAFGRDGLPPQPLYAVRFHQRDVWPDYEGAEQDTVDVDVYEHWLEPPGERL